MSTIGQMMGDPGTGADVRAAHRAALAELAKQERDLAAALGEDRPVKRPPVPTQPVKRQPRWIAPGLTG